nr:PREDICTED: roquin-1 [Bemisia tabaci]
MPIQAPQWTEFLSCPVCCHEFDAQNRPPINLACSHTICRTCLTNLHRKQCPFDQIAVNANIEDLPVNTAILQLGGADISECDPCVKKLSGEDLKYYLAAKKCVEELAVYLKPFCYGNNTTCGTLSRPMQRKLVALISCQLLLQDGRVRALRAARSIGERSVTDLILQHQNPQQLSANLWAAVRARGCQFLGPAMQEEVLRLVLLALEDGSALSRKVLVMFVVQRLEPHFPQASKTSIGHVVQLLYRASCFKVSKRDGDSSLMQLKDEFRTYDALRREHDAQIVEIATEAGLRIAPDQWSALLYGDAAHKSHMQSIIDKLQSPQSFVQSVQELIIALQRTGDPGNLSSLRPHLQVLASLDPSPENNSCEWSLLCSALESTLAVVAGLSEFVRNHGNRKANEQQASPAAVHAGKYKVSLCRDLSLRGSCPRGDNCTFAHSEDELDKYRTKHKKPFLRSSGGAKDEDFGINNFSFSNEVGGMIRNEGTNFVMNNPPPSDQLPSYLSEVYSHSVTPHSVVVSSPGEQVYLPRVDYGTPAPLTEHLPIEHARQQLTRTKPVMSSSPTPAKVQKVSSENLMGLQTRQTQPVSEQFISKCREVPIYSTQDFTGLSHPQRHLYYRTTSGGDDEFVPFDPPIVSKYGPISRSVNPTQSFHSMSDTATGSTQGLRSPVASWYFNPPHGLPAAAHILPPPPGGVAESYITIGHHPIFDAPHLFIGNVQDNLPKDLRVESQKVKNQLRNLEKMITDLKLATQGGAMNDRETLNQELQLIEQGIKEKEKELRLNKYVSSACGFTSHAWQENAISPSNFLRDDEDTYEKGIADDMRELELRWAFELEEQEKQWTHQEPSSTKK